VADAVTWLGSSQAPGRLTAGFFHQDAVTGLMSLKQSPNPGQQDGVLAASAGQKSRALRRPKPDGTIKQGFDSLDVHAHGSLAGFAE